MCSCFGSKWAFRRIYVDLNNNEYSFLKVEHKFFSIIYCCWRGSLDLTHSRVECSADRVGGGLGGDRDHTRAGWGNGQCCNTWHKRVQRRDTTVQQVINNHDNWYCLVLFSIKWIDWQRICHRIELCNTAGSFVWSANDFNG